jgi:hypothetical protein
LAVEVGGSLWVLGMYFEVHWSSHAFSPFWLRFLVYQ